VGSTFRTASTNAASNSPTGRPVGTPFDTSDGPEVNDRSEEADSSRVADGTGAGGSDGSSRSDGSPRSDRTDGSVEGGASAARVASMVAYTRAASSSSRSVNGPGCTRRRAESSGKEPISTAGSE